MCIDNLTNMILSKQRAALFVGLLLSVGVVAPAAAQATGKLNDTGLTTCADASNNNVTCAWVDTTLSTAFPRQDPEFGRSAKEDAGALTITGSDPNSKGFDFTKVAYTGTTVTNQALDDAAGYWGCTKDNVTGLIWDMKVVNTSATVATTRRRINTNTYSWKSGDSNSNGNNAGGETPVVNASTSLTNTDPPPRCYGATGETCDTQSLIAGINALNICGETTNDWRLPTRAELLGLVNAVNQAGAIDPTLAAVDSAYFPNIMRGSYWTADNVAGNPNDARTVNFAMGRDGVSSKSRPNYVILVRPGSATGTAPPVSYDGSNCKWRSNNLLSTPQADFTDHADGTVTHTKTGLRWKKCIQGRTYDVGTNTCTGTTQTFTWQNALKAAPNDATNNYTWRLPSRNELMSIIETACSSPMINTKLFPNIPAAGQFWTSTHAGQNVPDSAWAIRFDNGTSLLKTKSQTGYALLVSKGNTDDDYWRYPPPVLDTTPDGFAFTDQTGVARSTLTESNQITISGINTLTPISVSGGEYRIGAGAWTSVSGNVSNNSLVAVRHTSSASFNTATDTTLTVGGVSDTFRTTTELLDTVPNAFVFVDQADVARSTLITSASITVAGINSAATISVTGGTYSVGCTATYIATNSTVSNGQTVCVRHTSSANYLTAVNTTLTIGGVSDIFTSTTLPDPALDTTPDAFAFTDQTAVALNSTITSNTLTITGLGSPAAISVSGGSYSVGCTGTFTTTPATISNNQTVCVRHTSAATGTTITDTVLTIGGVSDTFRSTTGDATPDAFLFADQDPVPLNTVTESAPITVAGISIATPISVSGGEYKIGAGGAYTTVAGTVTNGQAVYVRHTSANSELTATDTTLTIGGVSDIFTSTTGDQTPATFAFTDQTNVVLGATVTSAPITVSGITVGSPISVSGGTYSIGCTATYVSTAGTVTNGQTVCVRHTASGTNSTAVNTTLTIGGVSDIFTSTTVAACGTASWSAVNFASSISDKNTSCSTAIRVVADLCPGTAYTFSRTSTSGTQRMTYTINGGTGYISTASGTLSGTVNLGFRFTQEGSPDTYTATLVIGGVSKTWTHTTNNAGSACTPSSP